MVGLDGTVKAGPVRDLQRRPPWSLVLPRRSTFLGSEDDDWQLNAAVPVAEEGAFWTVALTSMTDPGSTGSLTVCAGTQIITRAELGPMVQTLTISRTTPALEDALALEVLRMIGRTQLRPDTAGGP